MLRDQSIIMIASAPWRIAGKVNCHHLAERLAEHNRVLFVESPGLRTPDPRSRSDIHKVIQRGRTWVAGVRNGPARVHESLHVLSPLVIPMHGRGTAYVNRQMFGRALRSAVKRLQFSDPLLWVFPPTGVYAVDAFSDAPVIYHCVDHYAGIKGVNARVLQQMERRLLERAGLVFTTSQPLAETMRNEHSNVVCVPNVADVEHFEQAGSVAKRLRGIPRPIIGYLGYLSASMIDFDLLNGLVERRPDWSFVLVGPVGDEDSRRSLERLRERANVYQLPPCAYADAPSYVRGFDVGLIPFVGNSLTHSALPLKTFEYLAAGIPVVSTPLEAMRAEPLDDVVAYADDVASWLMSIEAGLRDNSPDIRSRRQAVAQGRSWSRRFPEIERIVNEHLSVAQASDLCRSG